MEYLKVIRLKNGKECILRNGTAQDGKELLSIFLLTHEQTDYLASYPDESTMTDEGEAAFLKEKTASPDEIEILGIVDGTVIASAGINRVGSKDKVKHRADFGISVNKAYWGQGIGRALTKACIECAGKAGYAQLELEVVAENERAISLYESEGFVEYGRNPKGFKSRHTGWQELVLMRKELMP